MRNVSVISKTDAADLRSKSSQYLDLSFILGILVTYLIFYAGDQPSDKIRKASVLPNDVTQIVFTPVTKILNKVAPHVPKIPVEAGEDDVVEDVTIDDLINEIYEDIPMPMDNSDSEIIWDALEKKPTIIFKVAPIYPDLAIRAGTEGTVFVQFLQDENGIPTEIKVLKGHPLLQDAAVEAIKQYRFSSAEQNGRKVKVRWSIPVKFKLN